MLVRTVTGRICGTCGREVEEPEEAEGGHETPGKRWTRTRSESSSQPASEPHSQSSPLGNGKPHQVIVEHQLHGHTPSVSCVSPTCSASGVCDPGSSEAGQLDSVKRRDEKTRWRWHSRYLPTSAGRANRNVLCDTCLLADAHHALSRVVVVVVVSVLVFASVALSPLTARYSTRQAHEQRRQSTSRGEGIAGDSDQM